MNVLFVTPRLPYPPLKGDQLVEYHRLRYLGKRHSVTLVSFADRAADEEALEWLREHCKAVHVVTLPPWRSALNVAALFLRSRLPLQVLYYHSPPFRRRVRDLLATGEFDVVHAFFHRVAPYVTETTTPKVLDLMDSMQLRMRRNAELARPPKRWVFREELRRNHPYEASLGTTFDHLIVVAEQDKPFLGKAPVTVVPNGVDADEFAPRFDARTPETIVFHGNMSYEPNVKAVTWFVEQCLPRIRRELPHASLVIAGSNPARAVRALEEPGGVRVTGFVGSMPATLNEASVAIAPMRSGSGIQNKILEAMACGLPVVATSIGLGSIAARRGSEIVVADAEDDFADAVVTLLRSPDRAQEVGRRARAFVLANHSWERAAAIVDAIYRRVVEDRRSRTGVGARPT